MKKTYDELPGWLFEIGEISVMVYEVRGYDNLGHTVSCIGYEKDLDRVIEECKTKGRRAVEESKEKAKRNIWRQ